MISLEKLNSKQKVFTRVPCCKLNEIRQKLHNIAHCLVRIKANLRQTALLTVKF